MKQVQIQTQETNYEYNANLFFSNKEIIGQVNYEYSFRSGKEKQHVHKSFYINPVEAKINEHMDDCGDKNETTYTIKMPLQLNSKIFSNIIDRIDRLFDELGQQELRLISRNNYRKLIARNGFVEIDRNKLHLYMDYKNEFIEIEIKSSKNLIDDSFCQNDYKELYLVDENAKDAASSMKIRVLDLLTPLVHLERELSLGEQ